MESYEGVEVWGKETGKMFECSVGRSALCQCFKIN